MTDHASSLTIRSGDITLFAPTYRLNCLFKTWVVVTFKDGFVVGRDTAVVVVTSDKRLWVAGVGVFHFHVNVLKQAILVAASSHNVFLSQVRSYHSEAHSQAEAQSVAKLQPSLLALTAHLVPRETFCIVLTTICIEPLSELVASVAKFGEE